MKQNMENFSTSWQKVALRYSGDNSCETFEDLRYFLLVNITLKKFKNKSTSIFFFACRLKFYILIHPEKTFDANKTENNIQLKTIFLQKC